METSPNAGCQQQKRHTVVGSYKGRQSSRNKQALFSEDDLLNKMLREIEGNQTRASAAFKNRSGKVC